MRISNSSLFLRQSFKKMISRNMKSNRGNTQFFSSEVCNSHKLDLSTLSQNSIFVSESRDIYENLAFEDWLYNNMNFTSSNIFVLLMWYNSPAVIIGRHQNPWVECSLDFCQASGISIARRNSGGGTVYHDYGNLNCSFMSPRQKYDRKNNLQIICDGIHKKWSIDLSISKRDDILLDGEYKVSGTASKLGRTNSYHHCTVLIDVNGIKLKQALHKELPYVESRATSSVKAIVKNLKEVCPEMNVNDVVEAIKAEYKSIYGVTENNIFKLNPKEDICPGISSTIEHLKSWKWCFGHTPRFIVSRIFPLCPSFSKWNTKNLPSEVEIKLDVNKGVIESISFTPEIMELNYMDTLKHCLIGMKFSPRIDIFLEKWIKLCSDELFCKYIKSCIIQIISDVYR